MADKIRYYKIKYVSVSEQTRRKYEKKGWTIDDFDKVCNLLASKIRSKETLAGVYEWCTEKKLLVFNVFDFLIFE